LIWSKDQFPASGKSGRMYRESVAPRFPVHWDSMPPVFERPFTLLVGGRPILSFVASTFNEANELTREEWLRADLLKYRSNDEPLWDGTAKLSVRASDAEEKAALEQGLKETAIDDGITLVYLVELDNA
jgi:hypothetical protein